MHLGPRQLAERKPLNAVRAGFAALGVAGLLAVAGGTAWQARMASPSAPSGPAAQAGAAPPSADPAAAAGAVPGGFATAVARTLSSRSDALHSAGLDAAWLHAHGFTPGSEALERLHALLDGRTTPPSAALRLPLAQAAGTVAADVTVPQLSEHARYVQAVLPVVGLDGDAVLVRWSMAGSAAVVELSAQALPPTGDALRVWRHEAAGWTPGHYRVDVLSADAQLRPLATGEFEIVAHGQPVTPSTLTADAAPR